MYNEPINSPFIPNEQKQISQPTTKYYDEAPKIPMTNIKQPMTQPFQQPKPLVDLQVYQQQPPKPQQPKGINPAQYVPMNLPVAGPYMPPQYPPMYNPYWPMYSPQLVSPIIKQYSINNAPFLETTTLKMGGIREDVLPKQMTNTSNTLGERLNIHSFVRSVFIKTFDGEDIDIDGQGNNSILRYLKFLELNPYAPDINTNNPYMGMPTDMLLYKSCYPIKYDDKSNSLQCSPNSLGMNVRIYTLSVAEYNIRKLSGYDAYDYDVWREMSYYEYIRENILKKKKCPNFVLMHCYYISENCNIDKNKVLMLKGKSANNFSPVIAHLIKQGQIFINDIKSVQNHILTMTPPFITLMQVKQYENRLAELQTKYDELIRMKLAVAEQQQLNKTQQLFTDISDELKKLLSLFKKTGPTTPSVPTPSPPITTHPLPLPTIPTIKSKSPFSPALYDFSGKGLVTMTESPTYNFYDWASIKYESKGNIHTMINTGFHTSNVWMSVLFQIMVALHVLQSSGIAFNDFTIGDNIYIKDIADHNNGKSYWKYIIDSYEYYIPNYGYLVLIDTNFKDCNDSKIFSNIFQPNKYDVNDLNDKCFKAFVNTFDVNNFTKSFSNNGGSGIPDDVRKLLSEITGDVTKNTDKKICNYITKYMSSLLNNRLGTNLLETEHKFINNSETTDFKKGQMIVNEVSADTYKFVVYIENVDGNVKILTKDSASGGIIESQAHRSTLKHYSKHEQITQNMKDGMTFNETDLLEIYAC